MPTRTCRYGIEGVERFYAFLLRPRRPSDGSSPRSWRVLPRDKLFTELKGRDPGRLLIVDLPPVLADATTCLWLRLSWMPSCWSSTSAVRSVKTSSASSGASGKPDRLSEPSLNRASESSGGTIESAMYEQFYGLREKPFALTPDPAYLYLANAIAMRSRCWSMCSPRLPVFALITGEVGCGKTTVVRHFLERARQPSRTLDSSPIPSRLLVICRPGSWKHSGWRSSGASPNVPAVRGPRQARIRGRAAGPCSSSTKRKDRRRPASKVLRTLQSQYRNICFFCRPFLSANRAARDTALQRLRQFAQRIASTITWSPAAEKTVGDVRHRVNVAGGPAELFTPEALELVHECTGGVPRLVNIVCDTALLYAFSDQRASVGIDTVEQVIQDRAAGGLLPLKVGERPLHSSLATG